MKRCPECRRDYYDDTLLYCLDDGAALLEGPSAVDQTPTAILPGAGSESQPATKLFPSSPEENSSVEAKPEVRQDKTILIGAVLLALAVIIAFVGYRFISDGGPAPQIESIAVLPLINDGGSEDVEYIADGIAESLTSSLSRVPDLSVKARSSVFSYKGKNVDLKTVGRELGVQAILTGRVLQRGEQITLALELVNTQTGNQVWGEQYSRRLAELLTLQSDIARDVSRELRRKLTRAEEQQVLRNYTADTEAYQLYLKGRYHTMKVTRPETEKSITYFLQAIERDPSYALAYAGLADSYRALAIAGEMTPSEYLPKGKAAALKAIEIDENVAQAHAVLGFIVFWADWNWSESEKHLKRAMELDPSLSDAHIYYANLLSNLGRHDEAVESARRARELDPLNTRVNALEAQFLLHAGRPDEALNRLNANLELDPNHWLTRFFITSAYIEKKMYPEAIAEARRARSIYESPRSVSFLGYALARSGREAEARAELAEMLATAKERYVSAYNIAMIYNGLGDREQTLAWLERGIELRDPRMIFLTSEPKWHNLKGDARFAAIISKVGLPK
jgi:TolB-like protein/tetratricopeptide (TPR) repeat protein